MYRIECFIEAMIVKTNFENYDKVFLKKEVKVCMPDGRSRVVQHFISQNPSPNAFKWIFNSFQISVEFNFLTYKGANIFSFELFTTLSVIC